MGTLRAVNATATIDRLLDFFPGDEQVVVRSQLAETPQLVFSQRLLRRANGRGRVVAWEKVASSVRVKGAIREGRGDSLHGATVDKRMILETGLTADFALVRAKVVDE